MNPRRAYEALVSFSPEPSAGSAAGTSFDGNGRFDPWELPARGQVLVTEATRTLLDGRYEPNSFAATRPGASASSATPARYGLKRADRRPAGSDLNRRAPGCSVGCRCRRCSLAG